MTTSHHAPLIRDATMDDVRTIVEFNRRLARETERKELDVAVLTLGVERAISQPGYCRYFIAELAGEVVGQTMITYEWSDWRNGLLWWIQSVYVDERFRGRGVFRALHQHIHTLAHSSANVRGLRLYVEHQNEAALATYRRMGMAPTGHLVYEQEWSGAVRDV
ncbi:MAG TPA: GNAT family N-acetyltransferase [Pirellulales bacterium]|jgi:ribosomal protein S18 acetylase RimI-like enzyme